MANIVALTKEWLEETIALADKIFPPEFEEEPAKDEIPASLFPEQYREYLAKTEIKPGLKYWVAADNGKVIGLIGLYNYEFDPDDLVWLGWFLVDPSARKKGIGNRLLLFAIEEAKKRGKKFLKLYSTDDSAELDSHRLYEKYGFRNIGQKPWGPDPKQTELFFELDLTKI